MKWSGILILAASVFFFSCNSNGVYERMSFFPKHEWSSAVKPSFTFQVTDTSTAKDTVLYRAYIVIRHTDAYHFKNIWLNIKIKTDSPSEKPFSLKKEFTLADNEKWFGTTVDDIVEQRIWFQDIIVKHPTKFTFTLQQIMREDPLLNILNAGIRVEKVK